MSAIKDGRYPITLDKQRYLLFSLNVLDELQDKVGSFDNLDELMDGREMFKNLKWLLTLLINEGAADDEEPLTEKQVGKMIHTGNISDIKDSIFSAFTVGTSGDDSPEADGDNEKNLMRGQVEST